MYVRKLPAVLFTVKMNKEPPFLPNSTLWTRARQKADLFICRMSRLGLSQVCGRADQLALLSALIFAALVTLANSSNIDTDKPILREVSGLRNDSLFGYSLVLHQTSANPTTMDQALRGAR